MPKKDPRPSLKERAAQLTNRLKACLAKFQLKQLATDTTAVCLTLAMFTFLASRAPEMHDAYLRNHIGSKVYMIKASLDSGGGTGFQVKAPSGRSYLLTNSHVCNGVSALREDKQSVLVVDDSGQYTPRRILSVSDRTDLCLIEGMPGVDGLALGSEPEVGTHITIVGHPHLRPVSLSSGEVVGSQDINILEFVWPTNTFLDLFLPVSDHPGKCNLPKNEIRTIPIPEELGGGILKSCWNITKDAYMSSATIFPGNSGSPVVNYWGHVVGVAFAADSSDNYGDIVNLSDIEQFLAQY